MTLSGATDLRLFTPEVQALQPERRVTMPVACRGRRIHKVARRAQLWHELAQFGSGAGGSGRRYGGAEDMTISIAGRCERTGMLGVAISSSSPCVAARCAFARAGVGAVLSQNITDPRLGPRALDLMQSRLSAPEAVARIVTEIGPVAAFRQLVVVDTRGETAVHNGVRALGTHASARGTGCAAAGNLLANPGVPQAMIATFMAEPGLHLAERLLLSLEAGLVRGGEAGPLRSAGLLVVDRQPWPLVDLRCDWEEAPISRLAGLWNIYKPQMNDYVTRALDPAASPTFGVPGDP